MDKQINSVIVVEEAIKRRLKSSTKEKIKTIDI